MPKLLELDNLKIQFHTSQGVAPAVDGVSYSVDTGSAVGLVGESGCGKTVTSLAILKLIQNPGRIAGGKILFDGVDLVPLPEDEMRRIRGNKISMIFQEPMTALNPVFTVGSQIGEAVILHRGASRKQARDRSIEMLQKVGIPSPEKRVDDYPHQLSGGMRQRAMIAMALSCDPKLIIADEPTTALDVTIQAQILDLMTQMKETYGASILLITHNLGVVAQTCQKVVVMYAGKVVEEALVDTLFANPAHPYTIGLMESIPSPGASGSKARLKEIKGQVPSLYNLPQGCYFHPRCPRAMDICREQQPELKSLASGSRVSCWLY
ncbi:MAG: ABC transporter ATP-binding protein [Nitrospinota bacterium]|nr:ABC transporter ATP-binding protein [Nitrospinota bacterium]